MPTGDEQVLAVIPNAELSAGVLGDPPRAHTLILTDQRILFARFTAQMAKELGRQPASDSKRSASPVVEKYLAMTPETILAEHKANFAVDRDAITKVKTKFTGALAGGAVAELLTIKTTDRTFKLSLSSSKQARKALLTAGLLPEA